MYRLKNGPGFPFPHEHVLGLIYLGGNVMAPAAIRVVGYHYPLMGLLYLVQRSTLSYAKDQRCFPSAHLSLESTGIELTNSWHCGTDSEGLPCLNHVSASQCSSSDRQPSYQWRSHWAGTAGRNGGEADRKSVDGERARGSPGRRRNRRASETGRRAGGVGC